MNERCPVTDKIDCQDRMCELHYMGAPLQLDPSETVRSIDEHRRRVEWSSNLAVWNDQ